MSHPALDLLEHSPDNRSGWLRDLEVTSTVVLLLVLSFVLGRASTGHDTATGHAGPAVTVSAAPSENSAAATPTAAEPARAEEARHAGVQISPTAIAGHNLLSQCEEEQPC